LYYASINAKLTTDLATSSTITQQCRDPGRDMSRHQAPVTSWGFSLHLSVGVSGTEGWVAESVAVFLIVFTTYFIAYRIRNRRFERMEWERMGALKAKGAMPDEKEKGPVGNHG
jgi:hypothetical protein